MTNQEKLEYAQSLLDSALKIDRKKEQAFKNGDYKTYREKLEIKTMMLLLRKKLLEEISADKGD